MFTGQKKAMSRLGCQHLAKHPSARVLIGGLGMGYSLRTALDILGEDAQVLVAELVPAVVEWNQGVLADLAGRPLDDGRTELHVGDVVQLIKAARAEYDAILLDIGQWRGGDGPRGQQLGLRSAGADRHLRGIAARRRIGDLVCPSSTGIPQAVAPCRFRGGGS